jgi:hypothetical protein
MTTDRHLKIEKLGKVWRATYDGVTICSCSTKHATECNAEYLMRHMPAATWRALVARGA